MTYNEIPFGDEYDEVIRLAKKLSKDKRLSKPEQEAVAFLAELAKTIAAVYLCIRDGDRVTPTRSLFRLMNTLRERPKNIKRSKIN